MMVGALFFVLGVFFAAVRAAPLGQVGSLRVGAPWVMVDYRHVVYYPSRAFWEGINPYNSKTYLERYPVEIPVSLYPPMAFLLFLPLALLPVGLSSVGYFLLTVALTLVLAWAALRLSGSRPLPSTILAVGGILLLSRPGHWNLLSGQITLIVVLAAYVALTFARRAPRLAGLGLVLALVKPTFGLPLVPALLARGAGRAVVWGLGMAAALNLPLLVVLVSREGGLDAFLTTLAQTYRAFASFPDTDPVEGVWRVDLAATVSRLLDHPVGAWTGLVLAALALAPVILLSRRLLESEDADQKRLLDGLVCCALLLSVFHQAYDLLLLALPATALGRAMAEQWRPRALHLAQVLLLAALGINYVATQSALTALQLPPGYRRIVVSANGLALLALFGLYLIEAARSRRTRSYRSVTG